MAFATAPAIEPQKVYPVNHYRSNFLLPLLLGAFAVAILPMTFANDESETVLCSASIDSGSSVMSFHSVLESPSPYNQFMGYHTKYYGWPTNAATIAAFAVLKHGLNLDYKDHFFAYALTAKLFPLLSTLVCVALIYYLALQFANWPILAGVITVIATVFTPFLGSGYIVKPDTAGLAFALCSFLCMWRYVERRQVQALLAAASLTVLAVMSKPYFAAACLTFIWMYIQAWGGFAEIPRRIISPKTWADVLACLAVSLITIFAVHPFLILDFANFQSVLSEIAAGHSSADRMPLQASLQIWWGVLSSRPLLLIGLGACGLVLVLPLRGPRGTVTTFRGLAIYSLACTIIVVLGIRWPHHIWYFVPVYSTTILVAAYCFGCAWAFADRLASWSPRVTFAVRAAAVTAVIAVTSQCMFRESLLSVAHNSDYLAASYSDQHFWVRRISDSLPPGEQTVIYSATLPWPNITGNSRINTFSVPQSGWDEVVSIVHPNLVVLETTPSTSTWPLERSIIEGLVLDGLTYAYDLPYIYPPKKHAYELETMNNRLLLEFIQLNICKLSGQGKATGTVSETFGRVFSDQPIPGLAALRLEVSGVRIAKQSDSLDSPAH